MTELKILTDTSSTLRAACLACVMAAFGFVLPAQAGTCTPVTVKGHAKDAASATTQAQIKLTQKIVEVGGGKATQTSTNCKPMPGGVECKTESVICP